VAVPNQALPAVIGALVGMFPKKAGYFGFNSLSKQRSRAVAQNIGQSIGEGPWLNQSKNVSVGHGVSLLRWRSGGVKHPHDTPPYPFMPSPTFANSSAKPSPIRMATYPMKDPIYMLTSVMMATPVWGERQNAALTQIKLIQIEGFAAAAIDTVPAGASIDKNRPALIDSNASKVSVNRATSSFAGRQTSPLSPALSARKPAFCRL
jgi:hypothetical protein